jgi:hypothetical protein
MKLFLLKIILILFPVLTLLIVVNYIGDAARIFDKEYENKMSSIIHNGSYVTNISNYEERLFQKYFIKSISKKPDIVVIGSSRSMYIRDEYFENQILINSSVSGASVEDLIAIYQIYKSQNILPNRIILGVDPWIFNSNNGQKRWLSINFFYNQFKKRSENQDFNIYESYRYKQLISLLHFQFSKYKQLLSISYFQSSLQNIPYVINGNLEPVATKSKLNFGNTILLDGSLVYGVSIRERTYKKVIERAIHHISGEIYSLKNFNRISEKYWRDFYNLIKDMKENNIDVSLFLPPYHPIVFEKIRTDYSIVLSVEQKVRDLAKKENLEVFGSFDPQKEGLSGDNFFDGIHCNEMAISKILDK